MQLKKLSLGVLILILIISCYSSPQPTNKWINTRFNGESEPFLTLITWEATFNDGSREYYRFHPNNTLTVAGNDWNVILTNKSRNATWQRRDQSFRFTQFDGYVLGTGEIKRSNQGIPYLVVNWENSSGRTGRFTLWPGGTMETSDPAFRDSVISTGNLLGRIQINNQYIVHQILNAKSWNDLNARSHNGRTALMYASENMDMFSVQQLVQNGANVNLRANRGETAASIAYDKGYVEIYDFLKANGARDFEPLQQAQAPAPQSGSTTIIIPQQAPQQPQTRRYQVNITYETDVGNRMTVPVYVNATSAAEAKILGEGQWHSRNIMRNRFISSSVVQF